MPVPTRALVACSALIPLLPPNNLSHFIAFNLASAAASALSDFKNPYQSTSAAVTQGSGTDVGVTYVSDDGTEITITTRVKDSTESKFNLSNTVIVE